MAEPVTRFTARRWRAASITAALGLALWMLLTARALSLRSISYVSGWTLVALMVFLTAYNARKKLTYPPLLRSSIWLQLHAYGGVLTIFLFLVHTGFRIPNGSLETALAIVFAVVAGSGIVGLVLSRLAPARIAMRGQEVIFERIPAYRRELREQAESLVVECARQTGSTTLAEHYRRSLADFFAGPRNYWRHLRQSRSALHRLTSELGHLDRYLDGQEREAARELAELIEAKDALDYHRAMQGTLKCWLFVHVPLTYSLLLLVAVHAVLAYAFTGKFR